jgi:TetR/AcrR family transcriptional regulator
MTSERASSEDAFDETDVAEPAAVGRKRPKPGERRLQILQALATMLQQPDAERITTALLARQLGISEAALYRHFASKAQMFDGLIEFIETTLLGLVQHITDQQPDPLEQARRVVLTVLQFAEKNPGMCRLMVGDALVHEKPRLMERMDLFFDKLESALKLRLREAQHPDPAGVAALVMDAVSGRLQRYTRSGFKRQPTADAQALMALLQ